jgi:hypothetical protein
MKQLNSFYSPWSLLLTFMFISCATSIPYVGDTYPPTSSVDVYYSVKDIRRDYRIMGRMTRELIRGDQEKNEMIEQAKRKGAEGIIFYDLEMDAGKSSVVSIKAELIRYL